MDEGRPLSSFFRRQNPALLAFEHSPLIQACLMRYTPPNPIASDELAAIAKSDRPVDIAKSFTILQQLNLLESDYRQKVASHTNPEYLAKALGVLLSMGPLPTAKVKIFFEVIVKSIVPSVIAKVLSTAASDFFYSQRVRASILEVNRTMLVACRFPQAFAEALSYLEENAAHIFTSDQAIMAIQTIGSHAEPLKAAQLLSYLFKEKLLTSDNCERVAKHSNPLALLRALAVSIDNEDKYRLGKRCGPQEVATLLQANFEVLSKDSAPEWQGFSLLSESQKIIDQRLAHSTSLNHLGSFFSPRLTSCPSALASNSPLSLTMASSVTLSP